jgi:hypothetical protein
MQMSEEQREPEESTPHLAQVDDASILVEETETHVLVGLLLLCRHRVVSISGVTEKKH